MRWPRRPRPFASVILGYTPHTRECRFRDTSFVLRVPVIDDDHIARGDARSKARAAVSLSPDLRGDVFSGIYGTREPGVEPPKARRSITADSAQQGSAYYSIGRQTGEDGPTKSPEAGNVGVCMQRIVVTRQAIQECLFGAGGQLYRKIRRAPLGHWVRLWTSRRYATRTAISP